MKQERSDQFSFIPPGSFQPKKSNIFVTNERNYDLESARRFLKNGGKFVNLTDGTVGIFRTQELLDVIREKIKDVGPEDWLLISGSGIVSALAVKALSERFPKIRLLIWDAVQRSYKTRIIN